MDGGRAQQQFKKDLPPRQIMPELVSVFPKGAAHAHCWELKLASLSGGVDPKWELKFHDNNKVSLRLEWK